MPKSSKLADVALEAGVSVTTASVVLNRGKQYDRITKDCIHRVQVAAEHLGYVPNHQMRSVRTGKTQVIGLIIELQDTENELTNPQRSSRYYFHEIADGIQTALTPRGYYLMQIWPSPQRTAIERGIRAAKSKRIDGMIALQLSSNEHAQRLKTESLNTPIISIEERQSTCIPSIAFDEQTGITLLINHLLKMGHRNFLWVGPDTSKQNRYVERELLMLKAIAKEGCHCDFCYFPEPQKPYDFHEPNLIETTREHVAKRLQKSFDFTAVIAYSDVIAIGAHRAIVQQGLKIPDDLSLVGYDAQFHEYLTPRLTTIDHRLYDMGHTAGSMMLKMLNCDPTELKNLPNPLAIIQPQLVVGDSVTAR